MYKKLPYPHWYFIVGGLILGLVMAFKSYLPLIVWDETEYYNFWKRGMSPIVNFTTWGLMMPLVYQVFYTYPYDFDSSFGDKVKAIFASMIAALILEFVTYLLYLPPLLFLDEISFGPQTIKYLRGAIPSGFISRFLEYWIIYGLFKAIEYYRRSKEDELTLTNLENQLNQSKLNALRYQLQPHFLFNTLNTISSLMDLDVKQAQTMTSKLGNLMRRVLAKKNESKVRLEEELEFIQSYLKIEEIRFQDRLEVKYDIDEDLLSQEVPSLILQPIIENAIKHGFGKMKSNGEIKLTVRRVDESFFDIIVVDNGPGANLPPKKLLKKGIGLQNVRERLASLYPGDHKLEIQSSYGQGFSIRLRLPIENAKS